MDELLGRGRLLLVEAQPELAKAGPEMAMLLGELGMGKEQMVGIATAVLTK